MNDVVESSHPSPRRVAAMDRRMLELLACPLTKGPLRYDAEREELVSPGARLAYPVRDGIPIMLPSEARKLEID
jgi:uncharacterized protein YbaR (Trm112 family)